MEGLTLEKLEAVRQLFKVPPNLEQDVERMFNVADRLPETSGEYFVRWRGFHVWMRFNVRGHAWYHAEQPVFVQSFPSHWLGGGRQSLLVNDVRRPERAPETVKER